MVNVLATGSTGNAVIYHNSILLDCGVPFSVVKPYLKQINLVLLTHQHKDHINTRTLDKLISEKPTIRIGCCEWMFPFVSKYKKVDYYSVPEKKGDVPLLYHYDGFSICPIKLQHDVHNCGYRIFKGEHKLIHATDTCTLELITAKGYDLFCIESNYNSDTVWDTIKRIEAAGGYAYQRGSINSHLSEQQCNEFYYANKGEHSQLIRLHQTKTI